MGKDRGDAYRLGDKARTRAWKATAEEMRDIFSKRWNRYFFEVRPTCKTYSQARVIVDRRLRDEFRSKYDALYAKHRNRIYEELGYDPKSNHKAAPLKHIPDPTDPEYCVYCDGAWPCKQNRRNEYFRERRQQLKG